ncbi:DVU_1553 family AMP-dependent CoA ligase [Sporomusa acidovorans]|uniref:Phenylacetate-coenzyme A ligase n=1 Tax=Sporomusa acidovorans (strain ATCC 49682 / DSM 3132 / Mol) TaxID=1123286 RepID=A0ABZ3IXP2_SPOA4|nr:AMP-binding protein [Sporomusa acidovorans]OZC23365.1 phenylacetate-coenzyme A ligase [Sporomusa acidovorans DSM 3132]SDE43181.1 Phenylacetate-coenzyme A ligase PaaK, adenylate-forming domain family [Sporomusa acidovorans]
MDGIAKELTPLEGWIAQKIDVDKLSLPALRDYQNRVLLTRLNYVKERSAFYRELYKDVCVSEIRCLADWEKLPLIRDRDLREHGSRMLCVGQEDIHRIVTLDSSGTTGAPKRIFFSRSDQELTVDFFANGMTTMTKSGDKVLILLPCVRPGGVGDLLARSLGRFGALALKYGPVDDCQKVIGLMLKEKPQVVVANPVQMLLVAYWYRNSIKQGTTPIELQAILLSTDYIADSIKERLTEIFQCRVHEHYGMTEMGLGGGVSCSALRGYHLREADIYWEVVDQSGKSLPVGEYGEIVFTTLTRDAMPLIRYATGDKGRFLKEPCSCGSVLPCLDKVKGRLDSPLDLPALDEIVFAFDGVLDYQGTLKDNILLLTVYCLEPGHKWQAADIEKVLPYRAKLEVQYGIRPYMYQLKKRQISLI